MGHKDVYAVRGIGDKALWTRVGIGVERADGSLLLRLEVLPADGVVEVRDRASTQRGTPMIVVADVTAEEV